MKLEERFCRAGEVMTNMCEKKRHVGPNLCRDTKQTKALSKVGERRREKIRTLRFGLRTD
jgi:hypothetical protein